MMPKARTSKATSAKKLGSRGNAAKKRIRRVIFKADEWYASAAHSIGIAGRPKGRSFMMAQVEDKAE